MIAWATPGRWTTWRWTPFRFRGWLVLSVVPGKRTARNERMLVQDVKRRTAGRMLNLIPTDE
ncbi:MAG: hypothetical protein WC058_08680 [Phycisphaeraceae bacterium]